MIGRSNHRIVALIALSLVCLTVGAWGQSKQELGNQAIDKIEQFRRSMGRLPNSLAEAGIPDSEHSPILYCITTADDYIVLYGPIAIGRLNTYRSTTKTWKEEGGGACFAPATAQEQEATQAVEDLEKLPSDERAQKIVELALHLRRLPASTGKVNLAASLANESVYGEFDRGAAQQATTTLQEALREHPTTGNSDFDSDFYRILAQLVRYEHLRANLSNAGFAAAMSRLAADDERREKMDFTLPDLRGKNWRLRDLGGKVVLVYFWAPWCFPCLSEMPDLEALYEQYQPQGLIILGVTSNVGIPEIEKVVVERKITYPILLDENDKVWNSFDVRAFSQLFAYGRDGKLLAQTPDMRTRRQLMDMLAQAGIH